MHPSNSILETIGNTPLVKLNKIPQNSSSKIFVKLEYYNPTASYKDRMALAIIEEAEKDGILKPGYSVVEATGGSAGSSLALVCGVKGYKVKLVTSDAYSEEKRNTMRALGAELTVVLSNQGKVSGELVKRLMEKAEELSMAPNTYYANQMQNRYALKGYNRMGEEIIKQLDGKIHAFVASFGSAGCVMGVAEVLKRRNPETKVFIVEPSESPLISKGWAGAHHIEGIGDGIVPPLLRRELYDEVIEVTEEDSKNMARRLAREEGIFAGTSTGANIQAALQVMTKLGESKNIVTIAVDSGLKYSSTELYGTCSKSDDQL
jgi:cysteine synthase